VYHIHASITCVSYLCILCMFHPYVLHVVTYDVKLNKVFVISPICVWSFRHSHWWPLYHLMHMHRINTSIICVLYSHIDHICITYVYPMHVPAIGTSCRHLWCEIKQSMCDFSDMCAELPRIPHSLGAALTHVMHMHHIHASIICVSYSCIDHMCIISVHPMHVFNAAHVCIDGFIS